MCLWLMRHARDDLKFLPVKWKIIIFVVFFLIAFVLRLVRAYYFHKYFGDGKPQPMEVAE